MKTAEEMAEEFSNGFVGERRKTIAKKSWYTGFEEGIKAAKNSASIDTIGIDHDADRSKLIKPTDTVGKEELKCMIAHFENEDYKISVMVPGILPKDEGGELVRGVGLIIFDLWKK